MSAPNVPQKRSFSIPAPLPIGAGEAASPVDAPERSRLWSIPAHDHCKGCVSCGHVRSRNLELERRQLRAKKEQRQLQRMATPSCSSNESLYAVVVVMVVAVVQTG